MATSGINTKDFTVDYIVKRADKLAGGQPMSGADLEDAMDMLNELMISLSNAEHPLSRIKEKSIQCSASIPSYDFGGSITAVYDAVITRTSTDYALNRIGRSQYLRIPVKNLEGKPSQYMVDAQRVSSKLYLYPVPSQNDVFKYRAALRPQLVTSPHQTLDLHDRYIPAIIFGLAYKMSFERRGVDAEYRLTLKAEFDRLLNDAEEEDRERTDWRILVGN